MQSTGQTSMQSPQSVQLHTSTKYCFPSVTIARSGQTNLQLSQETQTDVISRVTMSQG